MLSAGNQGMWSDYECKDSYGVWYRYRAATECDCCSPLLGGDGEPVLVVSRVPGVDVGRYVAM
jgi:hypothetical protein